MLKKENRLTTRFQFNITRDKGIRNKGRFFHAFMLRPDNYSGHPQFGIVVSTKVTKSAVKRNRIKRIYREIIRKNLELFNNDLWVVVQPVGSVLDKDYEEISSDFIKTVQEISIPR